ncbi:nicotinamidase-related amidase [Ruminiclostridium sufflavum DSM 19573]|uniref:Nicotinamidase-related amidase n=1 Tax=Ruminiclostridium sufflavum DSM 19573 TaxID=1121337 RepID=A0A318XRI0_9FIRM|nr:isochorismatase family cysteine hydrolase [Ruminiclostridium sufflavum]PYG90187.1 nicotinamidase-related amidase [Ruminiclostridium sufflavum DSM 19573]
MKTIDKKDFLSRSTGALDKIFDMLAELPELKLEELKGNNTALVIVDMINGFAKEGALSSVRVYELIPGIAGLSVLCDRLEIKKLAFADCHTEESPEFGAYPKHCIAGSSEGEIVDEIKKTGGYILILKNSTNGFLEESFQKWLKENQDTDTFIITGDCTDICVQQLAVTLKAWFNMRNKASRIIVPIDMVDTYDFGLHDGELMNATALYNMIINGIEVVRGVKG